MVGPYFLWARIYWFEASTTGALTMIIHRLVIHRIAGVHVQVIYIYIYIYMFNDDDDHHHDDHDHDHDIIMYT